MCGNGTGKNRLRHKARSQRQEKGESFHGALQFILSLLRRFLTAWLLVASAALAARLGGYPLFEPDEGRNGEVGREMAATNDYVLPHIDGLPYLDKPIVYFAAEAVAMEMLGATEVAARLPALLFTLLTAGLVAWFARRVEIDPLLSAIIFLAMPLTIAFARTVIFDSALTFFIGAATCAFYCAAEDDDASGGWSAVAWAAIALGVLTKGPVAIALPLLVAVPYAIWRRRFRSLWSWSGFALFVVLIAPWVWGVSRKIPDFLHYVLVTETAQRLTTPALKRTGPPWYFIPYLIGGAFPWSIAAFFGDRQTGFRRNRDRFLLLWIAVPFIFFSLSQSKRPQYILPLMPAVALLVASRWNERMTKAAAVALAALGGVLLIGIPRVHLRPEYAMQATQAAYLLAPIAIASGVVAFFLRKREAGIAALTVPLLLIPIVTNPLMQALALRRSEQALATAIGPHIGPSTPIIGLEAFSGSLAFYLQRPIIVVSPDGEEFTSNYIIRHYAQFADRSVLRRSYSAAPRGSVVIVRANDTSTRRRVEADGGAPIAESGHYAAYTIAR